jgi:hypothetical protein
MKPIRLSEHAQVRCIERGGSEAEVKEAVSRGPRVPARRGKWKARWRFESTCRSPLDGMLYNEKMIEVVYADEPDEIVVVTVKVYYAGREE